jgi:DNA-binding LytR/AlgR family response regulator
MSQALRVLVVDDEQPAVDDVVYLLSTEPGVGEVSGVGDATAALRHLQEHEVDVVFLDIKMPGLDGLELARLLARFARPPGIVFVTAYDQHAVEAFDLSATDYLLKPVRRERLRQALDRARRRDVADAVVASVGPQFGATDQRHQNHLSVIAVETGGRMRLVERDSVAWVEARGDYVRLHGAEIGSHLVRVAMATLEEAWEPHGFFRIHRGYLVSLRRVEEMRTEVGRGCLVRVDGVELPVSRRHVRDFRERLLQLTDDHA